MNCPADNPSSPAPEIPRFAVTMRNSSHAGHDSCLSVPESFWDLHRNKLMRKDLTLKGPTRVEHSVKVTKAYSLNTEKRSVCLEAGWAAFVAANRLRAGDTLEYSLIADSSFIVDLLILID